MPFVEKTMFSPLCILGKLVKDQFIVYAIYVSLFLGSTRFSPASQPLLIAPSHTGRLCTHEGCCHSQRGSSLLSL